MVDAPRKEWLEVYTTLYKTAFDPDPKVRIASILTIGYIVEEVHPKETVPDYFFNYKDFFTKGIKKNILISLIGNFNHANEELIKTALDALIKFCPMIKSFTKDDVNKFDFLFLYYF